MIKLIDFWKKNSAFIVSVLAFLFLMDYCGRIIIPPKNYNNRADIPLIESTEQNVQGEKRLKNYEEIIMERNANEKTNWPVLAWLSAIVAVGAAGYFIHKKGWLKNIMPGRVSLKSVLLEEKKSGRLLMRLTISNTTALNQTFLLPDLLFKTSHHIRRFRIKSDDFPLTLTPGTSHNMLIDINQFWERVPDLVDFNTIGAEIETGYGKVYKSMMRPKWWVFKRI